MEYEVEDQEIDQRGPGERLCKKTVKHVNWTVVDGEADKGCLMINQDRCEWVNVSYGTRLPR